MRWIVVDCCFFSRFVITIEAAKQESFDIYVHMKDENESQNKYK